MVVFTYNNCKFKKVHFTDVNAKITKEGFSLKSLIFKSNHETILLKLI